MEDGARPNDHGQQGRSGSRLNEGLLRVLWRGGRQAMVLVCLFTDRIEALFFGVGQEGRLLVYERWHKVLVQMTGSGVGAVLV